MLHKIKANFHTDIQTVPPSYKMKHFHYHDRWELFYLVSGTCSLYIENDMYLIEAGCIVLIPEGIKHMTIYHPGSDHDRRLIYFDTPELDWLNAQTGKNIAEVLSSRFIVKIPSRRNAYVTDLISKIAYEHGGIDEFSIIFDRTYFHELILFLLRCRLYNENVVQKMDIANETIQKVTEYIIANYNEDITLSNTAKIFNMSESSLSKKFKTFTGYRFKEYVIDVRTHAAADMLLNTSLSMTEIADKCGFSDSNTFGDTFKRIFGCCPSAYRKNV